HSIPTLQTEYTQLASYGGDVLVEHDITFDLYRQIFRRQPSLSAWWNCWRWERFERRALRRTPVAVVMSDKDAALSAHPRARVIANGVNLDRFRPVAEPAAQRVLFIGSFRHFPNVLAFRFLAGEVWRRVRAACPRAELTVVAGPDPLPHWQSHSGSRHLPAMAGMRLLEYVPDVKPLYEETNVVVAPTLVSAGTNIKVLEAMAMGRAVVSTPSGCAGLGLKHEESVWIAEGAEAFSSGLVRLLRDSGLREQMAMAARRQAEREFSWRSLGAAQRRLWEELSPSGLRIRPMQTKDLESVGRIQQESRVASEWQPRDYLSCRATVAECDGHLCGFLAIWEPTPGEWEVLNLAVGLASRRQGVASRLLEEVVEQVRGEMFLEVRESNHAARELYRRYQFEEAGVRPGYYNYPPEPAIVMKLRS
ncbi:MAG: GNAT family N-acetyltransferase, partial [Acidobacteriia bacterium]|nr:GNAT family N-acetyltransferase [Terriglobia bacterium]